MSKSTTENLFTRMYSATKEQLDIAKRPYVERSLKKQFETMRDNALVRKIDLEASSSQLLENVKKYDVVKALNIREEMKACDNEVAAIEAHYLELFGEPMKPVMP